MSKGESQIVEGHEHLLGIEQLSASQIESYLESAEHFVEVSRRKVKKVPALRGKTIINLFFEPSTRTRISFELAAKRLSADAINFTASSSSSSKGESLLDTALTLQAMQPDVLVVRHKSSGVPEFLARQLNDCAIVNAGDGLHEHPSQALLDALTIRRKLGTLSNLKVAFVGDSLRSRVVRSNIYLLKKFGSEVRLVGPPSLVCSEFEALGAKTYSSLEEGIRDVDVVVSLRMKQEYASDFYVPNLTEYSRRFCLTETKVGSLCPDAVIMAPGPIIRGIEIGGDLAEGLSSEIETQVEMGVAVRMAILLKLGLGGNVEEAES